MPEQHSEKKNKSSVQYLIISVDQAGQRIDNFLINYYKNVPKSHIYRLIRKGEVRINKKRITASYKLQEEDHLRLPPVYQAPSPTPLSPSHSTSALLKQRILYEDDNLLILNKPSGIPVHAGSTVRLGVIEAMRHIFPKLPQLELAHRLDTETSGCLILAKRKRILRELHELLRAGQVSKIYCALTLGQWKKHELRVDLSLHKHYAEGGKHVVRIDREGKSALSEFIIVQSFIDATLVDVRLHTGRTHQIRVHAQAQGHPLAGDDRYGDTAFNKLMRATGLRRLFLHAKMIEFTLPSTGQTIRVEAPLDAELINCLKKLK